MSNRHPPLTPYVLPMLLRRISSEWESRQRIFDLTPARFFVPDPDCDLSLEVAGTRVATPVGPAAGPHTQLAQNIVLGWLAGGRSFELKTVQILDELEIGRPCIDMATVGFNTEWSQELSLDQSLTEYVKAAMLLEILRRWKPLRERLVEPQGHVFELSVGYDLKGIVSDRMSRFIAGMLDATPLIEELRPQIPEPFADLRELDFPRRLVGSATLSTFHGCPPEEIEEIAKHLLKEHQLDVTVKLNPTLLGYDAVQDILSGELGYDELRLFPEAFAEDLAWDRALQMIESLDNYARALGRTFGIKLTNTLVVENNQGVLPGKRMYLSGRPLHVLAIVLLDRLVEQLPYTLRLGKLAGTVPVAFSAGIEKANLAAATGLGLGPVTICSDLLQPGGYGRLAPMLRELTSRMKDAGCASVAEWQGKQHAEARAAGARDAVAHYAARLRERPGQQRYSWRVNAELPRSVPDELAMWDCCSCNICVTCCPNDAMLRLPRPPDLAEELEQKWQYFCLAELCNECGNCTTFCPEQGDPCQVKPRLFVFPDRFTGEEGPGFLVLRGMESDAGPFRVEPSWHVAAETDRVSALLNGSQGLPLDPEDLAVQARKR